MKKEAPVKTELNEGFVDAVKSAVPVGKRMTMDEFRAWLASIR